ncbi:MAG: hypothetical protein ACLP4V_18635 [Methylocella sp.]
MRPLLSDATLTPILVKMRGDKALKMIYASRGDHPAMIWPETSCRG